MIFDISHRTMFRYSAPVAQSQHLIHMSPREVIGQTIRNHSLLVEPAPASRSNFDDTFGNRVVVLDIEVAHRELVLHARSTIEIKRPDTGDRALAVAWDRLDAWPGGIDFDVVQFRCVSRMTTPSLEIADYAAQSFPAGTPIHVGAYELTRRIFREFTFDPTATDISTPIADVFETRRGVCQDFAHLALACLRAQRIPARYVSGYILTEPPPGKPKLQGTDASHAWISVWSPGVGWVDFDPTNGVQVANHHITIAYGRDYDDVSPISGVLIGGGEHTVTVGVDVSPVPP